MMWEFVGLVMLHSTFGHSFQAGRPYRQSGARFAVQRQRVATPRFSGASQMTRTDQYRRRARIGFENALKLASVREKLRLVMVVEEFTFTYKDRTRTQQYSTRRLVLGDRDKEAESLDYTPFIREVFVY
ncbi:hypothetical protein BKA82DRAFT_4099864, partial [Pisolithus tinctorius]